MSNAFLTSFACRYKFIAFSLKPLSSKYWADFNYTGLVAGKLYYNISLSNPCLVARLTAYLYYLALA